MSAPLSAPVAPRTAAGLAGGFRTVAAALAAAAAAAASQHARLAAGAVSSKRRRIGAPIWPVFPDIPRHCAVAVTANLSASIRAALDTASCGGDLRRGCAAWSHRQPRSCARRRRAAGDLAGAAFRPSHMGGIRLTWIRPSSRVCARQNPSPTIHAPRRTRFSDIVLIERHQGIKATLARSSAGCRFTTCRTGSRRLNAVRAFFGIPPPPSALPRLVKLTDAQVIPVITRQLSWDAATRSLLSAVGELSERHLDADVARMNAFIEDRIRKCRRVFVLHRRSRPAPTAAQPV